MAVTDACALNILPAMVEVARHPKHQASHSRGAFSVSFVCDRPCCRRSICELRCVEDDWWGTSYTLTCVSCARALKRLPGASPDAFVRNCTDGDVRTRAEIGFAYGYHAPEYLQWAGVPASILAAVTADFSAADD